MNVNIGIHEMNQEDQSTDDCDYFPPLSSVAKSLHSTFPSAIVSVIRPSHMLRYCTPAMGRSKAAAMCQHRMRCSAMQFPTCWKLGSRYWNISAIYCPIFKRFAASYWLFHELPCDMLVTIITYLFLITITAMNIAGEYENIPL